MLFCKSFSLDNSQNSIETEKNGFAFKSLKCLLNSEERNCYFPVYIKAAKLSLPVYQILRLYQPNTTIIYLFPFLISGAWKEDGKTWKVVKLKGNKTT